MHRKKKTVILGFHAGFQIANWQALISWSSKAEEMWNDEVTIRGILFYNSVDGTLDFVIFSTVDHGIFHPSQNIPRSLFSRALPTACKETKNNYFSQELELLSLA